MSAAALFHYDALGAVFDYPGADYPRRVRVARERLADRYEAAEVNLEAFERALPGEGGRLEQESLDEVQEIFTRSFDVQPITTLSVGYLLFGDDYKRGEVLVHLRREQRAAGLDDGGELPDHLANVLRLLARWDDRDLVEEFVLELLGPAIEEMIGEFDTRRSLAREELYRKHFKTLIVTSAERGTMFREPLMAVRETLRVDFPALPERTRETKPGGAFLRAVERELVTEREGGRPARSKRRR